MPEWRTETVEECLVRVPLGAIKKLQTQDYRPSGLYPIIDQGQALIAGWTDDDSGLITQGLPVVVFGDHTRAFKYIDFPFVRGADGTQVLKPKDGINPLFFYYALCAVDLPGRGYNRHFKALKEKEISIPPDTEQSDIARVLKLVDDTQALQDDELRAWNHCKRAAMRALFTRGLKGEALKETEIGPVPESWTFEKLGDIVEIAYGAQAAVANATDPNIGTLILTNVNLNLDGYIDLEKKRYYKIPEVHRDRLSLSKGDVLFNWRSGSAEHIGKTVYFDLDGEFTYSSFILRFRPHKAISSKFLFRWLTHLRMDGFFVSQRNVSSINSVYNASLSATIPIWFPESDEQREIVAILDAIDCKIDLHRRKRAVLDDLFKALLHKLTTGEISVADLNLSALEVKDAVKAAA